MMTVLRKALTGCSTYFVFEKNFDFGLSPRLQLYFV